MLGRVAATAVRKEATSVRDRLRDEAKDIIAEAAAAQIQKHAAQLEQLSQSISSCFVERLQRSVETCREDAIDCIVTSLKTQLALPLDEGRKVAADLTKAKVGVEKILADFTQKTSSEIQESCTHFERQFEAAIRKHLGSAGAELDQVSQSNMLLTLDKLRLSTELHEALAKSHLEGVLDQVSETSLTVLKEKSAEISRQSTEALTRHTSKYLESVGGAISELAKGLGNELPIL
jgi:hypothetical protein